MTIGELEAAKAAKKEEESCPCSCQEQPAEEVEKKVCPVCGESSDGKFCPKCGAPMGE